jgi:hypothetical protein
MKLKIINTIICSATMASVMVSAIFLSEIISISNYLFVFPYLVLVAVIYAIMLLSESKKNILLKWLLSLPLSYLCINYFWKTNYSIRALNWIIPDYGKSSVGGDFSNFLLLIFLLFLCLLGIISAFCISSAKIKSYIKKQSLVGILIQIIIVIIVIYLETLFPSYNDVMTTIYS